MREPRVQFTAEILMMGMALSTCGGALVGGGFEEPPGAVQTIVAGPLTLQVSTSRTAHLFHVVDQLSSWSPFCHRQYRSYFENAANGGLSEADRQMLGEHADLRRLKGWGRGLEQTFYTDRDLEDALHEGIKKGHLTAEQAATERRILDHFAPRVERLMREQAGTLEAFLRRMVEERERLAAFAERVSRFFGGVRPSVPVYLIANPSEGQIGGGFNGGRLTLEVPTGRDAYPSLLLEVFHAFLEEKRPAIRRAADRVKGLDEQTLNEGLAYALAPGMIHPHGGPRDPLGDQVASDWAAGKSMGDDYTRFNRFGLALRPLLTEALDDPSQTIDTFLPRSVDVWMALSEVGAAMERTSGRRSAPDRTQAFSFGPGWRTLSERLVAKGGGDLFSFNHKSEHYEEALSRSHPGDTVFLLFALEHEDRLVPGEFRDLLPLPWPDVEARLERGETVELTGQARVLKSILMAAPTVRELELLIRKTRLLDR